MLSSYSVLPENFRSLKHCTNLCLWSPAPARQLEGVDDDNNHGGDDDDDDDDDDDENDDDNDYYHYYFAKLTDLLRTVVTIDNIVSDRVNFGLT